MLKKLSQFETGNQQTASNLLFLGNIVEQIIAKWFSIFRCLRSLKLYQTECNTRNSYSLLIIPPLHLMQQGFSSSNNAMLCWCPWLGLQLYTIKNKQKNRCRRTCFKIYDEFEIGLVFAYYQFIIWPKFSIPLKNCLIALCFVSNFPSLFTRVVFLHRYYSLFLFTLWDNYRGEIAFLTQRASIFNWLSYLKYFNGLLKRWIGNTTERKKHK